MAEPFVRAVVLKRDEAWASGTTRRPSSTSWRARSSTTARGSSTTCSRTN